MNLDRIWLCTLKKKKVAEKKVAMKIFGRVTGSMNMNWILDVTGDYHSFSKCDTGITIM